MGEAIGQILEDDENDVDNVVIIPPEPEGNITDEDEGEEGSSIPSDVPGQIEVDHSAAEGNPDALHNDGDTVWRFLWPTVLNHEL